MSRECPKCKEKVPKFIEINGKKHNCQRRIYCFKCSPFGFHNTKKIEIVKTDTVKKDKSCFNCNKVHKQQGRFCAVCVFNKRKTEVTKKVQSIVGKSCWKCKYDTCWRNICFHHVYPALKLFSLSTREYMLKWERVYEEMRKCILLCHNCHGEVHEGLISSEFVEKMYNEFWSKQPGP